MSDRAYRNSFDSKSCTSWETYHAYITKAQEKFLRFHKEFQPLPSRLSSVTKECCKYINECPEKSIGYFLKMWLRLFVAIQDECHMLINGALVREYHVRQFQEFCQNRGKENDNHRSAQMFSACSVDGIDFEFRKFERKFRRHTDKLELLINPNHDKMIVLKDFANAMKEEQLPVIAALKRREVEVVAFNLDHNAQRITVKLPTMTGEIVLDRNNTDGRSQAVNLSATLGTPKNYSEDLAQHQRREQQKQQRLHHISATVYGTSVGSSKRLVTVVLDNEDREVENAAKLRAAAQVQADEAEKKRRAEDFSMDAVSIKQIKQAYGATDEDDSNDVGGDVMDVDSSAGRVPGEGPLVTTRHLSSLRIRNRGLPSPDTMDVALSILGPGSSDAVNIIVTAAVYPSGITGGAVYVEGSRVVSVRDLLDEADRQLWYRQLVQTPGGNDALCWGVGLRVAGTTYNSGATVTLPVTTKKTEEMRIRVVCRRDPVSAQVLQEAVRLVAVGTPEKHKRLLEQFESLWALRWLMERLCGGRVEQSGADGAKVYRVSLCGSSSNSFDAVRPIKPDDSVLLSGLLKAVGSAVSAVYGPSCTLSVDLSRCGAVNLHLSTLLRHCESVSGDACGLNHIDLLSCCEALCGADGAEQFRVSSLSLQGNRFLAYCDSPWMLSAIRTQVDCLGAAWEALRSAKSGEAGPVAIGDPTGGGTDFHRDTTAVEIAGTNSVDLWAVFIGLLLTRCATLESLDISQCAVSITQATVLLSGLQSALLNRHRLGLAPLKQLVIRGLYHIHPRLCNDFKAWLLNGSVRGVIGAVAVELSGARTRWCL